MLQEPKTMAARVYEEIKADILTGVFPPGTHLVKRALAHKYGVSVPPVTEACLRLEIDGLVESSPMFGSFVIDVTPDTLEDELDLREALECQLARLFVKRASEHDKAALQHAAKAVDEVAKLIAQGDMSKLGEMHKKHYEFHALVAKGSGTKLLSRHLFRLWQGRLQRNWSENAGLMCGTRPTHDKLAKALAGTDADEAERRMREHISKCGQIYINHGKK